MGSEEAIMTDEQTPKADNSVDEGQEDITLSTGVVLRAHKANPMILIKVMATDPEPKPPTEFIEAMGREVENYMNPEYQERLEAWRTRYNSRLLDAMLGLGTEIVSVPDGVPKLKDNSWVRKLEVYGIDTSMKDEPEWRKINWIMSVACEDEKDLTLLQKSIQKFSGVAEEDVAAATKFSGRNKK